MDFYQASTTLNEFKDCKIADLGFSMKKILLAFTIQKNSPYRKPLNRALRKMLENGKVKRIKKKYFGKEHECAKNGKGNSIGFSTFVFFMGICFVGMCSSLLLVLCELAVHHFLNIIFTVIWIHQMFFLWYF